MRLSILIGTFCICVLQIHAQKFTQAKVSINDLNEKLYAADTTAEAAILSNVAKTTFKYHGKKGFTAIHQYHLRIKIYKKEGLKWANFQVPYYVGYEELSPEYIRFSNGVTYNLENGNIVKTKLTGEGSFKDDVNEFWNVASVTMPNVKVGSIIEFTYTLKSENLVEFPVFNFQYDIPVKYALYETELPEFFIYKPLLIGFGEIKSDAKIEHGNQNFSDENNQTVNLSYQQINGTYISENIPALKNEPFVDNLKNYRSAVQHELSYTRFPDAPQKNYAETWDGVAKNIFKDKRFGKELAERLYFEQDLAPVIKSATTHTQKMTAIFEFVKHRMNWNKRNGYYALKGVKKAYIEKSGNAADINFILISMLNHAGINANPVLLSTIDNGIPVYPNRTVFNYVIAAATIDGKQFLLDATDKFATVDVLPQRALNWTGRLIRQDSSSEEINLVPDSPSKQNVNLLAYIAADGKISGKIRIHATDYCAYNQRDDFADATKEYHIEELEDKMNGVTITDYLVEGMNVVSEPVIKTFSFQTTNHAEIIGGKIFLNPMLFFSQTRNPFTAESRKFPIYFGYPQHDKYYINIKIPDGYAVESMPENFVVATPENECMYTFKIVNSGNQIQMLINKEINLAIMSPAAYDGIRNFFQGITEKTNEKTVLKKI